MVGKESPINPIGAVNTNQKQLKPRPGRMDHAQLERIKGRLEGARDASDQEGVSYWRAQYIKDVDALINDVQPVETKPPEPTPEKKSQPILMVDLEGCVFAALQMGSELQSKLPRGLPLDQLNEAMGHLNRAFENIQRGQGKQI
jgi:hypothetical protein